MRTKTRFGSTEVTYSGSLVFTKAQNLYLNNVLNRLPIDLWQDLCTLTNLYSS